MKMYSGKGKHTVKYSKQQKRAPSVAPTSNLSKLPTDFGPFAVPELSGGSGILWLRKNII